MGVVRKIFTKNGFTLIELLVTVAVLSTVIFIGVDLFTTIIRGNNKATVTNEVRQNGQLVMSILERNIRAAQDVSWDDVGKILTIKRNEGPDLRVACAAPSAAENGKILLNDVSITNDNKDTGVNVSRCIIDVETSASSPKLVTVDLEFQQSQFAPTRQDFVVKVPFNSTFSLRNKAQ